MPQEKIPPGCAASSGDDDRRALRASHAVVVNPVEDQFAARIRDDKEIEIRIGGDAGAHFGTEYLGTVVAADQLIDHAFLDLASAVIAPESRFHRTPQRDPQIN